MPYRDNLLLKPFAFHLCTMNIRNRSKSSLAARVADPNRIPAMPFSAPTGFNTPHRTDVDPEDSLLAQALAASCQDLDVGADTNRKEPGLFSPLRGRRLEGAAELRGPGFLELEGEQIPAG